MNRLSLDRRTQIIGALVEGNSIRSTERMTDTHRDTIMRLLVEVGTGCAKLQDVEMRNLTCERLQVDELWCFVGKKQKQVTPDDDRSRVGDQWTFVAIDDAEPAGAGRYSPPHVVRAEKHIIAGAPNRAHISTSMIERQNLMVRMSMRRFTRLTNAFAKKLENLEAAVALHFSHYNLVRLHMTLRVTPAMAAGISKRLWSMEDLVDVTSN
ncbi:MAG: IS1 family transposase [Methylocella sp.]